MRPRASILAIWGITAAAFGVLIPFVFLRVPSAQAQAGGLAQKIFYFHVPAAYAFYVCGAVCFVASALYLVRPTPVRDAWARAASECAVVFGSLVLVSGPLWAKKAWGVYWDWDPRLTTLLLSVFIFLALLLLRRFAGGGEAENRFAATMGVLGSANLPLIHYAVKLWGGIHPPRVSLEHPAMGQALAGGVLAMSLLMALLLALRFQLALSQTRLERAEELAGAPG